MFVGTVLVQAEETVAALISQTIITQPQCFLTRSTLAATANRIVPSNQRYRAAMDVHTNMRTQLDPRKLIDRGNAINVEPLVALAATVVPLLYVDTFFTDLTKELISTIGASFRGVCSQPERVLVIVVAKNSVGEKGASDMQLEARTAAALVADPVQDGVAAAALLVDDHAPRHEENVGALVGFVCYSRVDEAADDIQGEVVTGYARICESIAAQITTPAGEAGFGRFGLEHEAVVCVGRVHDQRWKKSAASVEKEVWTFRAAVEWGRNVLDARVAYAAVRLLLILTFMEYQWMFMDFRWITVTTITAAANIMSNIGNQTRVFVCHW